MSDISNLPKRILLVSDGWVAQMSLCEVLENSGYAVSFAEDRMKAIAALENNTMDLVITEFGTHRGSAVDLLRFMKGREALRNIPVIVLILPWETQEAPFIQQAGAFGIVTVPYHPDDILSLVNDVHTGQLSCHNGSFDP
jgi:CheY-like chemotaxis protein